MASVESDLQNARVGDRSNFREGPPHELFRRLRSECPVHWSDGITEYPDEDGFWSVTTAEDVYEVSRDWETFSSEIGGFTATKKTGLSLEMQQAMFIDIQQELTSYSVDITSALAFGHDLNTLERGESELQGHIQRVFGMLARRIAAPVPYWRWVRLPADRALDRSLGELHKAVGEFIAQARERIAARPELLAAPENFLEGMIAAQQTDDSFTDKEIVGNTLTLLFAGEDTTAHTLGWTIWLLGSRADVQARLAAEASEILGENPFPSEYETVARFDYGEAVLRESMRIKSVSTMAPIEPLKDTTICDTHIPAGTRLLLLLRHAALGERADAFEPERWLDQDNSDPKSLTFGAGPRFCPGRNLAMLEAKTALAMIARNFEIELDRSGGPVSEYFNFTMIPKGLRVRLRERAALESMPVGATRPWQRSTS